MRSQPRIPGCACGAVEMTDDASLLGALPAEAARVFDGLDLLINNAGMTVRGERFGSVAGEAVTSALQHECGRAVPAGAGTGAVARERPCGGGREHFLAARLDRAHRELPYTQLRDQQSRTEHG